LKELIEAGLCIDRPTLPPHESHITSSDSQFIQIPVNVWFMLSHKGSQEGCIDICCSLHPGIHIKHQNHVLLLETTKVGCCAHEAMCNGNIQELNPMEEEMGHRASRTEGKREEIQQ
jgi:hypothetical protein